MALIVLVVAWAAFLLPGVLRARAENRPAGSISDFRRQLRVLARTSPAYTGYAPRMPYVYTRPAAPRLSQSRRAVKRRRDVLVGLLFAMAFSLVFGFMPPLRALWALHVVLDVLFVAYVGALVYLRNLAAEREMKVRFLPVAPRVGDATSASPAAPLPATSAEPVLLYQRSAN